MTIEEFINSLNFEENDYFYHVTEQGNADSIIEEGLYINGNNILNANNILETTTLPLTIDMVSTSSQFQTFLEEELNDTGVRDTFEFVVLGAPKNYNKEIVSTFNNYKDGIYYEGIIPNDYIMGYFTKGTLEFVLNEQFEYGTDEYYETMNFRI